jgi:acyl carrier protein
VDTRVKNSIREHIVTRWLNGDARGLDDETDLQQIGVLDSFSTLDLVSFLDEAFQVQIEPSDINSETFRTVSTIASLVLEKLGTEGSQQRRT